MKTTDGIEVQENHVYHFIKDNKIIKVKCTDIYIRNGYYLNGKTYSFSINYGVCYHPSELRGVLYKSYSKAKNRLKKSLKKTIRNYETILKELK